MIIEARNLSFAYGATRVLQDVSLRLQPGVTAIIGPNAAGKSTLLKCLAGLLHPTGSVWFDGKALDARQRHRLLGFLPQNLPTGQSMTVFETVLLGLLPDLTWRVGSEELQRVQAVLDDTRLAEVAERPLGRLSGGQLQMVLLAQAIVKAPTVLLLDEPTSYLDLRHQFEVLALLSRLTEKRGLVTVVALHDLGLAARFAREICVLSAGRVHAVGPPTTVLTAAMLAAVYGVEATVVTGAEGRPWVIPAGLVPGQPTAE